MMPLAATISEPGASWRSFLRYEQVLADSLLGDPIGGLVEVVGELPDGAEVGLLGALAEAGELEVLVHLLTKRGGHEWVLSQG